MPLDNDVTPVRENHRFDEASLERYLRERMPDFRGPLTVRQFVGGQSNPTFLLQTPDARFVMRKKPPGTLLQSAHQVEREFRIIKALAATDVPVPRAHLLCEDAGVIGTAFFVMDFVEGRIMRDPMMPGSSSRERAACYDSMNDVLARLHKVDFRAVGSRRLRPPASLCSAAACTLVEAVRSVKNRRDPRDGSADRMARAKYSGR